MTAYVTATLQNLLLRSIAFSLPRSAPKPRSSGGHATAETQPALFRSEGFAEDLFDSHPSH